MFKKRSAPTGSNTSTVRTSTTLDQPSIKNNVATDESPSLADTIAKQSQLNAKAATSHATTADNDTATKPSVLLDIDADYTPAPVLRNNAAVDIGQDKTDRAANKTGVKSQHASNVRQITVYDYKADICKDYQQSGFCSFGDSCKFIHDRSDYKQSWQMDAAIELHKRQKPNDKPLSYDDIARASVKSVPSFKTSRLQFINKQPVTTATTDTPFACLICKRKFMDDLKQTSPVVTQCGHYFCQSCALTHYSKSHRCAVCSRPTNGIFNNATAVFEQQAESLNKDNADSSSSDTET